MDYPALNERFGELERELLPAFTKHDQEAIRAQGTYRRFQFALIIGAAFTSFFGAVQAALGEDVRWAAATVALLGVATTFTTHQLRREQLPMRYLVARAKAEELRALYFNYLSGVELDDVRALETRVSDIQSSRQPADDVASDQNNAPPAEPGPTEPPSTDDEAGGGER